MPNELPIATGARTFTFACRLFPSGFAGVRYRVVTLPGPPFSPDPVICVRSSRGDSRHHAVFPALFSEALNEHENLVLSPELGEEDSVQLRGYLHTGRDVRSLGKKLLVSNANWRDAGPNRGPAHRAYVAHFVRRRIRATLPPTVNAVHPDRCLPRGRRGER